MIRAILFDFGNTLFYEEPSDDLFKDLLNNRSAPKYLDVYRAIGLRFDNICEASLEAVAYYYASIEGKGSIRVRRARELKEILARLFRV